MVDETKSTAPKPFVFVLMPFKAEFTDIYDLGIKGAAEKVGAYAERLDKQIFAENILQRLYNQINKADVIVADMTGCNANVFYEVGYAHALGKIVLLLTQKANDIPFDMQHYPHIVYGDSITTLRDGLINSLVWAINESKKSASRDNGENITVALNGIEIPESSSENHVAHINVPYNSIQSHGVLTITLHNSGSVGINDPIQMYLITERPELQISSQVINPLKTHRMYGEKTKMFNLGKFPSMYIGTTEQFDLEYRVRAISAKRDEFRCQIMVSSKDKQYSFPFLFEMR
jgi:nucleoside 2-deoxyribosyltransferase-like protein